MKNYITSPEPRTAFGNGISASLGKLLKEMGVKSAFVAYGQSIKKHGLAEKAIESLKAEDISVTEYDGVIPEAPDYVVKDMAARARESKAEAVVSIGGGSATDSVRAAFLLRYAEGNIDDYFVGGGKFLTKEPEGNGIFVAIPTTAGTGAEMGAGGPILDTKNSLKGAVFLPPRTPDLVLLDPELTVGLSPYLTYTTAMDALSHAIEGMTGKMRSHRSDMLCGQAVEYIWRSLPRALRDGNDLDARGELLIASGLAIRAETLRHIGHAVCQPVGARLHLAHGYTCALVLPETVRFMAETDEISPELNLIARKMGLPDNGKFKYIGNRIADEIERMNIFCGVKTLSEEGYSEDELLDCLPIIMKDGRLLPNAPKAVTEKDAEKVLMGMYRR